MTPQLRGWLAVIGTLAVVAAAAGWWVVQVVQPVAIVVKPAASSAGSPLASPVLDQLKGRSIVNGVPVADPGSSHRSDPFSK